MSQRIEMPDGTIEVPEGPRCSRCGHEACAICAIDGHRWCDHWDENAIASCSCEECDYESGAWEQWTKDVGDLLYPDMKGPST